MGIYIDPSNVPRSGEVDMKGLGSRAVGVGLAIGILVVTAVMIGAVPAAGAPPIRFASEQLFSDGNDWEPNVATDPNSTYVYMATTGMDAKECRQCPEPSILIRVSPDSGASWGPPQFICGIDCRSNNIAGPWQADPIIRVANDGTVYIAWLDNWNPGMALSKSSDHGATWTRPVNAGSSGSGWGDKPWLAISPDGESVYIAWNHGDPYVAASHDAGATFGKPVRLTPSTNSLFYYPESGVVAAGGTAFFSMSVETAKGTGPVDLVLVKSTDGGATWTILPVEYSEESPGCVVPVCITDEFQAQIAMDMDSSGTIMVVYSKNAQADAPKTLFARTSSDGGASWSEPSLVNDQPERTDRVEHVLPAHHGCGRALVDRSEAIGSGERRAVQERERIRVPVRRLLRDRGGLARNELRDLGRRHRTRLRWRLLVHDRRLRGAEGDCLRSRSTPPDTVRIRLSSSSTDGP